MKEQVAEAFGDAYDVLLEACSLDFGLHDALLRARSIERSDLESRSQEDVIVRSSVAALCAASGQPLSRDAVSADKALFGHGDEHRTFTASSGERVYYVNIDALPEQSKDERMRSALVILAELGSVDARVALRRTAEAENRRGS